MTPHPAKFSEPILEVFRRELPLGVKVLDPFAGTGALARIEGIYPVMVELEPEWATGIVGNALALPFADKTFSWAATSPCYGNRMADHHEARDTSKRHTYRHYLGRMPSKDSAAVMQWGPEYCNFHAAAWKELTRVCADDATFLLNISDHIRKSRVMPVSLWHTKTLQAFGWKPDAEIPVATRRQRHGENGELRLTHEWVLILRRQW